MHSQSALQELEGVLKASSLSTCPAWCVCGWVLPSNRCQSTASKGVAGGGDFPHMHLFPLGFPAVGIPGDVAEGVLEGLRVAT